MNEEAPLSDLVARYGEKLGIDASARPALVVWLELLQSWNARIDLTAARGTLEVVDLMLADAAVLAKDISRNVRVVDIGTGAGSPGLALALMRPDLDVTLVEPLAKRASFLRTVAGTVRRPDITILRERADAIVQRSASMFDVAISRATLPPSEWIPVGLALASSAWALLAREPPPRIEGAEIDLDLTYTWPATGAERRAVRYVRSATG